MGRSQAVQSQENAALPEYFRTVLADTVPLAGGSGPVVSRMGARIFPNEWK